MTNPLSPSDYSALLVDIKQCIRAGQYVALRAVNAELIALYWDIGALIVEQQQGQNWGRAVVDQLAADLRTEFPTMQGFSSRNLSKTRRGLRGARPIARAALHRPVRARIRFTRRKRLRNTIYFYSDRAAFGCFSNFSAHGITLKGRWWPTSEHYFQAQKFAGMPHEEAIRQAKTPRQAATMGRERTRPLRADGNE